MGASCLDSAEAYSEEEQLWSSLTTWLLPAFLKLVLLYVVLHYLFYDKYYRNSSEKEFQASNGSSPEPSSHVPFGWVPTLLTMNDETFQEHAGVDALTLLLFIRMSLRILVSFTIPAIILAWMYTAASDDAQGFFESATLAGVRTVTAEGSWWSALWWSVAGCYLLTFLTCYFLLRYWERVITSQQKYMSERSDCAVLVVNPPAPYQAPYQACLRDSATASRDNWRQAETIEHWERLYPGEIVDVLMIRDAGELRKRLTARDVLRAELEQLKFEQFMSNWKGDFAAVPPELRRGSNHERSARRARRLREHALLLLSCVLQQPRSWAGRMLYGKSERCSCRRTVAEVEDELKEAEHSLRDMQRDLSKQPRGEVTGRNYLVCFSSYRACNMAKQVLHGSRLGGEPGTQLVMPAPKKDDINYEALEPSVAPRMAVWRWVRRLVYWTILCFGPLAPTVACAQWHVTDDDIDQAVVRAQTAASSWWSSRWSGESMAPNDAHDSPGFIPTLLIFSVLLRGFKRLLPSLCKYSAHHAGGPIATSKAQAKAFSMLFSFELLWSFLAVQLMSSTLSLLSNMQCLIDSPLSALDEIGWQLANNATFFMIWLAGEGLLFLPLRELLLYIPIAIAPVWHWITARLGWQQPRNKPDSFTDANPYLMWNEALFTMTISMCYATVAPLLLMFAIPCLGSMYLLFGRNLLFAYNDTKGGTVTFWAMASSRLLLVLAIAQLVLASVHAIQGENIQESFISAATLIPALLITWGTWRHLACVYEPRLRWLPLVKCIEADERAGDKDPEVKMKEFRSRYEQPEFKRAEGNEQEQPGGRHQTATALSSTEKRERRSRVAMV